MGMPRMFKAMLTEAHRRRHRIRTAVIALRDEGMCRHVRARVVSPESDGGLVKVSQLRIEYVHPCGDNCEWLKARRIVDEQIGAW